MAPDSKKTKLDAKGQLDLEIWSLARRRRPGANTTRLINNELYKLSLQSTLIIDAKLMSPVIKGRHRDALRLAKVVLTDVGLLEPSGHRQAVFSWYSL